MTLSNSRSDSDIKSLVAEFNRVRAELVEAVSAVPVAMRHEAFVGHWDVSDVVTHTVGWDYTNIEALPEFRVGRLPAFFTRYDRDWAAINTDLVKRYRIENWDDLLTSLQGSGADFATAMLRLAEGDLDNVAMWGKRRITLRGMMRAVSKDESQHVEQVRAFLARRLHG